MGASYPTGRLTAVGALLRAGPGVLKMYTFFSGRQNSITGSLRIVVCWANGTVEVVLVLSHVHVEWRVNALQLGVVRQGMPPRT